MNEILQQFTAQVRNEGGFVIGRIALVVVILAIIIVAAAIAFLVPN